MVDPVDAQPNAIERETAPPLAHVSWAPPARGIEAIPNSGAAAAIIQTPAPPVEIAHTPLALEPQRHVTGGTALTTATAQQPVRAVPLQPGTPPQVLQPAQFLAPTPIASAPLAPAPPPPGVVASARTDDGAARDETST